MGSAGGLALARHLLQARTLACSCSAAGQGGCQVLESYACWPTCVMPATGCVSCFQSMYPRAVQGDTDDSRVLDRLAEAVQVRRHAGL